MTHSGTGEYAAATVAASVLKAESISKRYGAVVTLVDSMSAFQNVYLGREQLAKPWHLRLLNRPFSDMWEAR